MDDKNQNKVNLVIDQTIGDNLNSNLGVLTRREVEARIINLNRTQKIMEGAYLL